MSARTIRASAVAGAAGGMMMAMFSMIVLAASGAGFWTPVNLIAHTVWSGAPLDGTFDGGALLLGLALHMGLSMMLGVVIAAVIAIRHASGALPAVMIGTAVAAVASIGQLVLWPAIDEAASDAMRPWVFAVSHLVFGMIAGLMAHVLLAERHQTAPALRVPQPAA